MKAVLVVLPTVWPILCGQVSCIWLHLNKYILIMQRENIALDWYISNTSVSCSNEVQCNNSRNYRYCSMTTHSLQKLQDGCSRTVWVKVPKEQNLATIVAYSIVGIVWPCWWYRWFVTLRIGKDRALLLGVSLMLNSPFLRKWEKAKPPFFLTAY